MTIPEFFSLVFCIYLFLKEPFLWHLANLRREGSREERREGGKATSQRSEREGERRKSRRTGSGEGAGRGEPSGGEQEALPPLCSIGGQIIERK